MTNTVLHVLPERNLQIGGPAYSVPRLVDALADSGTPGALWSIDNPGLGTPLPLENAESVLWPGGVLAARGRGWSPAFARALRAAAAHSTLIHNHGLWMHPNRYARQAAQAQRIPLVCSPRGMLQSWSLQRSSAAKRLVWWMWEQRNLRSAALFHATSDDECQAIRAQGLRQPVAVIANGIDLPDPVSAHERALARAALGVADDQRLLLFLSRLHEKKALLPLLAAWQQQFGADPQWRLLLAGPDLDGYGERVRDSVQTLGLNATVHLPGMLEGAAKRQVLAAADAFVLPSHSENFGIAVAEAAAAGLPVLVSDAMPWADLIAAGGGWQVQPTTDSIAAGLARLRDEPLEQWQQRGAIGRDHVQRHLGWPRLATQMAAAYQWLLHGGQRPDCVHAH